MTNGLIYISGHHAHKKRHHVVSVIDHDANRIYNDGKFFKENDS